MKDCLDRSRLQSVYGRRRSESIAGSAAVVQASGPKGDTVMKRLLLVGAVLGCGVAGTAADDYPTRPIRLIVSFAPQ